MFTVFAPNNAECKTIQKRKASWWGWEEQKERKEKKKKKGYGQVKDVMTISDEVSLR